MWAWDGAAVGIRVKEERERQDLTLRELGKLSGVSHSYIGHLENGIYKRPARDKIEAIFRALGIELANDLGGPQEPGHGDARLEGADVNLLEVKNLSPEDFEALRAEILRRKKRLEEEQERGRRR